MEETEATRYWCHMCSQTVNPIMEIDTFKCPNCESGFIEEISSSAAPTPGNDSPMDFGLGGSDTDRALSLWAPILLGMMNNPRRPRAIEFDEEDDSDNNQRGHHDMETELDRELESIIRRRRRSSATILQLLQGIRAGMLSESGIQERERDNDVIFINPFNQTIIVRGNNESQNRGPFGSLGDYFVGPGLDLLLQHLADNDPNRYGTPPAQKEAVEALPTVIIEEKLQCCVCLDDCEIGSEVKEMPCKHRFHSGCILPWLELHSSCPVCRSQLPSDLSKIDSEESRNNISNIGNIENDNDNGNDSGRRFSVPLPWPFSSLFSSSSSQSSSGTTSMVSPTDSTTNAPPSTSREDDN